jgi:predicted amidophosphoribosyltransferase
VFPRIKELQKPKRLQKFEKFRRSHLKEMLNAPVGNCGDCKQAISLPNAVYCGLLKKKMDSDACRGCPYFDLEPSEYKLFKRT